MKKDISLRLAHKKLYKHIENEPEKQLNLLIVVDQMLTGFDSKWVNTLYVDKMMQYESIIQAFSRTNRLFGPEKPFGVIRYYRRPHTMERNVNEAIKLYSGDRPYGMFAEKIEFNLEKMNEIIPINGSMPAYLYYFVQAFIEQGVKDGIDYEVAKNLASQAIIGSAKMIKESGKDIDTLIKNVCSPKGATLEGLKVFEENNMKKIIEDASDATIKRAYELSNI